MSDIASFDAVKKTLRSAARRARAAAHATAGDGFGDRLAAAFLSAIGCPPGGVVSGYWPMGDEADVIPLLAQLSARGCGTALPVVVGKDVGLVFRRWQPGDALEAGTYGTHHPRPAASEAIPDLLLVPLLAFDRRGRRLGYGGGYYDRTLAALRAQRPVLAVGIAFAAQEVEMLPDGPYDQRLDWVVTEQGARKAAS
jgi:5-formyltetrahydrofolate cyclo-ligase